MLIKNLVIYLCIIVLFGCSTTKKEVVVQPEKKIEKPKPITSLIEKKIEIKYRYRGDIYRDPFISLADKKTISPSLESKGEGQMPILGTLSLKGIMVDKNSKIALLSSSIGCYILKNNKLYDSRNRVVPKIKGYINKKSVKLVTEDKYEIELKLNGIKLPTKTE
jgi:hypothetical protein